MSLAESLKCRQGKKKKEKVERSGKKPVGVEYAIERGGGKRISSFTGQPLAQH